MIQIYILLINQVKSWHTVKYEKVIFAHLISEFFFSCHILSVGIFLLLCYNQTRYNITLSLQYIDILCCYQPHNTVTNIQRFKNQGVFYPQFVVKKNLIFTPKITTCKNILTMGTNRLYVYLVLNLSKHNYALTPLPVIYDFFYLQA